MTASLQKWRLPETILGISLIAIPLLTGLLWLHGAWRTSNESIAEELAKFDRLRAIAGYRQALERAGAGADDKAYGDLFLKTAPAAIISANLLTQVKQMAAARGLQIMRAGDLQPKTEGPITLVGGSVEMSGSIPAIYGLVQQIEAAKPLLFIERLGLRSTGSNLAEDKTDTFLTAEMHIYGAVRSSEFSTSKEVD